MVTLFCQKLSFLTHETSALDALHSIVTKLIFIQERKRCQDRNKAGYLLGVSFYL